MKSELRITGDNPSPEQLEAFPNWENALDEEDVEGQDETTLRPAEDQTVIGEYVSFTAGTVWMREGDAERAFPAILEPEPGGVFAVQFFVDEDWQRVTRKWVAHGTFDGWEIFQDEGSEVIFFPMKVESRLPHHASGQRFRLMIAADGREEAWPED